ncbi:MAG: hypothetical protein J5988_06140, partial [Eubacterium sp.]|nr:hypothetical protein [Eubacterium sp.]
KCIAIYIREEVAKRIPNNRYRNHVCMNDDIFGNFFGEKPHRDGALAESRWGLNSYNKIKEQKLWYSAVYYF